MRVQFKGRSKEDDLYRVQDSRKLSCVQKNCGKSWPLKYEPTNSNELTVYSPKLREIRSCLDPNGSTRVLVLSGPPGSAKSTTIKLVAQEQLLNVVEFQTPESSLGPSSVLESFRDFLMGCSSFNRSSTLVMVEELPNVFHTDTRREFETALLDWCSEPDLPIVAISFTEIEVSAQYNEALVVPRVLGQLINMPACVHLKMSPPAATILTKLLKKVAAFEGVSIDAGMLKELGQCGDIRSALNALELYGRTNIKNAQPRDDISKTSRESPELWVRGTSTALFYAIGKVVWTSSKEGSLKQALEMFRDSMDTFNLTVLENYTSAKHQRLNLSTAANICEWLSLADVNPDYKDIAALAAAHEISASEADETLPKRFVATKFTQFVKWHREKVNFEAELLAKQKNRRLKSQCTRRTLILDELSYVDKIRSDTLDFFDTEDDSDDDFDFS